MALSSIHRLTLSWSTSRGRDTYGYNIARLDDSITGKRYRTRGGGYDMIGTVLADWFADQYQEILMKWQGNADTIYSEKFGHIKNVGDNRFYGMHHDQKRNKIILDGSCGIESITRIVEACGFEVERSYNKKGHTTGFYVKKVS